jgi:hypothetical protein
MLIVPETLLNDKLLPALKVAEIIVSEGDKVKEVLLEEASSEKHFRIVVVMKGPSFGIPGQRIIPQFGIPSEDYTPLKNAQDKIRRIGWRGDLRYVRYERTLRYYESQPGYADFIMPRRELC